MAADQALLRVWAEQAEEAHRAVAGHEVERIETLGSVLPVESVCTACGWSFDWQTSLMFPGTSGSCDAEIKRMEEMDQAGTAQAEQAAIRSIMETAGVKPRRRPPGKTRRQPVRRR